MVLKLLIYTNKYSVFNKNDSFDMKKFVLLLIFFTIEIYPQSWHVIGDMPKPVYGGTAIVQDSLIYIIGGLYYKNNSPTDLIQSYNPRTQEWRDAGKLDKSRYGLIAGIDSGKVIIAGGIISSPDQSISSLEIWNFNSAPYIDSDNSNFKRLFATAQIIGSNLFIFGGTYFDSSMPYAAEYDIKNKKIIYSGDTLFHNSFPFQQTSVAMGNYIYIMGGVRGVMLNTIYKFNTISLQFEEDSEELPKPLAAAQAVKFDDENIYIIGGFDETNLALSTVNILSIKNENMEFTKGPPLNYGRKEFMAVKYRNSIYVFGGKNAADQPVIKIEKLELITGIKYTPPQTVYKFELENNYPNPFNPTTQISFKIGKETAASLKVYSILGEHIKDITSREFAPGTYNFSWDGTDQSGNNVDAGVYIYRLTSGYFSDAKKMILLK